MCFSGQFCVATTSNILVVPVFWRGVVVLESNSEFFFMIGSRQGHVYELLSHTARLMQQLSLHTSGKYIRIDICCTD